MIKLNKVFVVGAGGMVGASAAYAMMMNEVANEIVLIDIAEDLVKGQAMDINHAAALTNNVKVRVGDYSEIEENDMIIVTSGAAQKPGQTRLELVEINTKITKDVVKNIMGNGKPVFILMVANPVDVLTYVALKESGLPKNRVFGSGTTLDTARLRITLANKLGISPRHVHGYILGEHGDSSFPALSGLSISGIPLKQYPGFNDELIYNIDQEIRNAAYEIISAKKATYFGIGNVVSKIVDSIVGDKDNIHSICSLVEGEYGLRDLVIGLPNIISGNGVKIVDNYPLSENELEQLNKSAKIIKEIINSIGY